MEWKDITTYSQGDTENIPRWWKAKIKPLGLKVGHYHIDYRDGKTWIMHCKPWFDTHILKAKNLEDAKKESIQLVKTFLDNIQEQLNQG